MNRTRTVFYSYLGFALLLIALIGGAIWHIKYKTREAADLLAEANTLLHSDSIAQSIRAIRATNQEYLGYFDTLIVDDESLVPFLELVEDTGETMGLKTTITAVSLEKDKTASSTASKAGAQKMRLTLETEGEWGSSLEYLHALENLPTQVMIDSATLLTSITTGSSTAENEKKIWRLSVALSVYSFK